jgi:NAD(P)-dependent dehydrogenase (short-subunit alcohol dehydrogenase family)
MGAFVFQVELNPRKSRQRKANEVNMTATQRVAIVTASDSGIGKTTALMLAERGFDIGVTWHSDEEGAAKTCQEVQARGRRAESIQLDLSHLPQGAKAIETLIARFGRLDVLVNNAGAMTKSPFLEMKFDEWRSIFTVDVDGAFLCSQIAAQQMVKQGEGGRIVNITSVHEHTPLPEASAYTAAKHALGGLTKSMALELVGHNILVNAVAPGAIATPMNDMDDSAVELGSMPEIPLGRPGHTKEIASLVAWLCDSDSSYATGQSYIVDGGFMLANPQFKPQS